MSTDVYTYTVTLKLEFVSGRLLGASGKACSPRTDFLFPQEYFQNAAYDRADVREIVDWVRNIVHEIKETEWFETRP